MLHLKQAKMVSTFLLGYFSLLPLAYSDDTEIFFGGVATGGTTKNNVLFVLDTSASMLDHDLKLPGGLTHPNGRPRIESLQEAFAQLMDSNPNINAGLMRFHDRSYEGDGLSIPDADEANGIYHPIQELSASIDASALTPLQFRRYIRKGRDDVQAHGWHLSKHLPNLHLDSNFNGNIGLLFRDLPIPKDSTIADAKIEMWRGKNNSPDNFGSFTVYGELTPNPESHQNVNRIKSPGSNWTYPQNITTKKLAPSHEYVAHANGYQTQGDDLKEIARTLAAQPGWDFGNNMSFIIKSEPDPVLNKKFGAFESAGSLGEGFISPASLIVKVDTDSTQTYTIKDELKHKVYGLDPDKDSTPTIARLLKAADYFKTNSDTLITSQCQKNHIILLSDGRPNNLNYTTAGQVNSFTGQNTCSAGAHQACGESLASYLQSDAFKDLAGSDVTVRTIGFSLDNTPDGRQAAGFLNALASAGGSENVIEASDTATLLAAFQEHTQRINDDQATIVTPGLAVNQFNSFRHENRLYYSMFRPDTNVTWPGNIKSYQLAKISNELKIADNSTPPKSAINPETGNFYSNTKSFWSSVVDGADVESGGMSSKLPGDLNTRNIYTDVGLASNAALSTRPITHASVTGSLLGGDNTNKSLNIKWIKGLESDGNTRRGKVIGDPLHSAPVAITYDCRTVDGEKYNTTNDPQSGCKGETLTKLFFGTNHGFLHAIDTLSGVEDFAFIPEELLANINTFRTNPTLNSTQSKIYGLDLTPVAWHKDINKDGVVNGNDKVYVYIGMRRGGNNYYALDVTNPTAPKIAWKIRGGVTTGFDKLAQTWSEPARGKIKLGTAIKNILIFGGGYDTDQDDASVRTVDDTGNALFIVDAENGELLWSATNDSTGDLQLPSMDYSIPSQVRALDMNADGFTDQLVFGDMGGQVWRLYINHGNPKATLVEGQYSNNINNRGVFARLSGSEATNNRRIYTTPSVAITKNGTRSYLTVAVGTGFRGHPLNAATNDRFYVLKSYYIYRQPPTSGPAPIANGILYNATLNPSASTSETTRNTARDRFALKSSSDATPANVGGWFINLNSSNGEKNLASSLIFNNEVRFLTYAPGSIPNNCNPVSGINRYYKMNLNDGTGTRAELVNISGIGGDIALMIVDGEDTPGASATDGLYGFDPASKRPEDLDSFFNRTFWIDEEY